MDSVTDTDPVPQSIDLVTVPAAPPTDPVTSTILVDKVVIDESMPQPDLSVCAVICL